MNRSSLVASVALVLVANTLALTHALRNRAGAPDSEVTLTQRELRYYGHSGSDDDTGVALLIDWTSDGYPWASVTGQGTWLDKQKLETLGFDCHVDAASIQAERYYQRQRRRPAFVAFAYDDATWNNWVTRHDLALTKMEGDKQGQYPGDSTVGRSHLIPVDADRDPFKLRARHPDRAAAVILPAVIGIFVDLSSKEPPRVAGSLVELPRSIHIPLPYSEAFRGLIGYQGVPSKEKDFYQVHLRYGNSF